MTYPSMDEMRKVVSDMYPGPNWKKKVKDMRDGQVMAIFKKNEKKREEDALKAFNARQRAKRGLPPLQSPKSDDEIPF